MKFDCVLLADETVVSWGEKAMGSRGLFMLLEELTLPRLERSAPSLEVKLEKNVPASGYSSYRLGMLLSLLLLDPPRMPVRSRQRPSCNIGKTFDVHV